MKILIKEEEKKIILEMHSQEKKSAILVEQSNDIQSQLQAFVDDGRVKGNVVKLTFKDPSYQFAIKQESTKTPGKFRYLFINKSVGVSGDGGITILKDTNWTPGQPAQKEDPNTGDIEREVATGNWIDRKNINVPTSELEQTYEQHPKYKNLWKLKSTTNKLGGFTPDQQSFINAWTGSTKETENNFTTKAYKINPSAADFATGQWTRDNFFIAPGSEVYFPADEKGVKGLKVFINVSKLTEKKEANRENCRGAIKTFVNMYRQSLGGVEPNAQVFADTKALVKLCKATVKFGGPFSKVDDDLKLLSGITVDGVPGPSRLNSDNTPNKWRID